MRKYCKECKRAPLDCDENYCGRCGAKISWKTYICQLCRQEYDYIDVALDSYTSERRKFCGKCGGTIEMKIVDEYQINEGLAETKDTFKTLGVRD